MAREIRSKNLTPKRWLKADYRAALDLPEAIHEWPDTTREAFYRDLGLLARFEIAMMENNQTKNEPCHEDEKQN